MTAVFDYPIQVSEADIDPQGHASNVRYVDWMQIASLAHSAARGWDVHRYHQEGIAWVVRSHFIEYRRPAFAGDRLSLQTWVVDMRRTTSLRGFRFLYQPTGERVASAETKWAMIDTDTRRLIRIPPSVREAFPLLPHGPEPAHEDPLPDG
jgi:acyl-CoA thioester hydrolase